MLSVFAPFGEVESVNILKSKGVHAGCAFVQVRAWGCSAAWVAVSGCCLLLVVAGCLSWPVEGGPCHLRLPAWAWLPTPLRSQPSLLPPSPLLPVLLLGQLRGGHRGAARQVDDAGGGAPAGGQVCGRQEERHPGAAGAQAGAWWRGRRDGRMGGPCTRFWLCKLLASGLHVFVTAAAAAADHQQVACPSPPTPPAQCATPPCPPTPPTLAGPGPDGSGRLWRAPRAAGWPPLRRPGPAGHGPHGHARWGRSRGCQLCMGMGPVKACVVCTLQA